MEGRFLVNALSCRRPRVGGVSGVAAFGSNTSTDFSIFTLGARVWLLKGGGGKGPRQVGRAEYGCCSLLLQEKNNAYVLNQNA